MRRALGWLLALVVALAATLAIALSAPPGQRLLDRLAADAPQGGAVVPPPSSQDPSSEAPTSLSPSPSVSERVVVPLDVPPSPTALPQAPEATPDAAAISAALTRRLSAPALGPHVVAAVAPLAGGEMLFEVGDGSAAPASTMKLMTTTAALKALGPEHRFTTRVVSSQSPGLIVLVGGGDPYLARHRVPSAYPQRADVVTLARATAEALQAEGNRRVRLGYDASLFPGPAANPRWRSDYVSAGIVSPTSALWVDEGRGASGYG
ncbi:MAG: D-alanyl-D-alanine carboxypeptidase, partial [Nocardioides sp.]